MNNVVSKRPPTETLKDREGAGVETKELVDSPRSLCLWLVEDDQDREIGFLPLLLLLILLSTSTTLKGVWVTKAQRISDEEKRKKERKEGKNRKTKNKIKQNKNEKKRREEKAGGQGRLTAP